MSDDLISKSHFDERVREAVGMTIAELTADFKDGVRTTLELLQTEPIVDAVRVVRCGDCEYYVETNGRIGTCELTISGAEDDGFCAWGERKNDADT